MLDLIISHLRIFLFHFKRLFENIHIFFMMKNIKLNLSNPQNLRQFMQYKINKTINLMKIYFISSFNKFRSTKFLFEGLINGEIIVRTIFNFNSNKKNYE